MGEEAAVARESLSENITVGLPDLPQTAGELAARNGLTRSAQLEELLDYLFGLSCRDQDVEAFDPERMAERRRRGFALAKSMQKEAAAMLACLERLHHDWQVFDAQVRSRPALLEAIFDVDTSGPESLFLPAEINILQSLFRTTFDDEAAEELQEELAQPQDLTLLSANEPCPAGFWEAADRRLQAVADLPIRSRLTRGPVPNTTVRDAVSACQQFWTGADRRWSMGGLKTAAVRHDNEVRNLTGACEIFVADALTVSKINFNLAELQSAWEWVDGASRDGTAARR